MLRHPSSMTSKSAGMSIDMADRRRRIASTIPEIDPSDRVYSIRVVSVQRSIRSHRCCMPRFRPGSPPVREDGVAAFRFRDPDLTPSTSKEGKVRITPTALRTNKKEEEGGKFKILVRCPPYS